MDDTGIRHRIEALMHEEDDLYGRAEDGHGMSAAQTERLEAVEVELDLCWDLLRQRQAEREFGEDPDQATPRPADTVEHYVQ